MVTLLVTDYINIERVSILQYVGVRHTVRDYIVHREADTFGKVHEIYGTWVAVLSYYEIVNYLVDFVKTHAYFRVL